MTLNTLSDLAAGRLILGIGAGMDWLPLMGTETSHYRPLQAVNKTIEVVRSLLSGAKVTLGEETVSLTPSFTCFDEAIHLKKQGVPIYIGAVGPRMTQLVGEIGDGLILDMGVRRDEIPARLEHLAEGASRMNRTLNSIDVVKLIVVSANDNGEIHNNALGFAARYVNQLNESEVEKLGFDPERVRRIKEEFKLGNCHSACRLLSPDIVSAYVAAGTPADCLRVIEGFVQAGVNLPILMPFGGDMNAVIEVGKEYANRSS